MDKSAAETIIALVTGVILGVMAASSFWYLKNKSVAFSPAKVENKIITPTPTLSRKEKLLDLEIVSPANNIVVNTKTVNLAGKSSPNTLIIISQTQSDDVVRTDAEGNFQKIINLSEGLNYLLITAVAESGKTYQVDLTIAYESK